MAYHHLTGQMAVHLGSMNTEILHTMLIFIVMCYVFDKSIGNDCSMIRLNYRSTITSELSSVFK